MTPVNAFAAFEAFRARARSTGIAPNPCATWILVTALWRDAGVWRDDCFWSD